MFSGVISYEPCFFYSGIRPPGYGGAPKFAGSFLGIVASGQKFLGVYFLAIVASDVGYFGKLATFGNN